MFESQPLKQLFGTIGIKGPVLLVVAAVGIVVALLAAWAGCTISCSDSGVVDPWLLWLSLLVFACGLRRSTRSRDLERSRDKFRGL